MAQTSEEEAVEGEVVGQALVPADTPAMPVLAVDHPTAGKVVKRLLRKTPKNLIQRRRGPGNTTLSYIPWAVAARALIETFGTYSFEMVGEAKHIDLPDLKPKMERGVAKGDPRKREEIMVTMRLSVGRQRCSNCGTDSPLSVIESVGSSVYYPDNPDGSYGDTLQAAQSYALRRAVARMGPGLDLYANTEEAPEDLELTDAQAAWRSELREQSLPEKAAIPILSVALTGDAQALPTLKDCLDATGETPAKGYRALVAALRKGGTT